MGTVVIVKESIVKRARYCRSLVVMLITIGSGGGVVKMILVVVEVVVSCGGEKL